MYSVNKHGVHIIHYVRSIYVSYAFDSTFILEYVFSDLSELKKCLNVSNLDLITPFNLVTYRR
jgi:hypothetical protein